MAQNFPFSTLQYSLVHSSHGSVTVRSQQIAWKMMFSLTAIRVLPKDLPACSNIQRYILLIKERKLLLMKRWNHTLRPENPCYISAKMCLAVFYLNIIVSWLSMNTFTIKHALNLESLYLQNAHSIIFFYRNNNKNTVVFKTSMTELESTELGRPNQKVFTRLPLSPTVHTPKDWLT